MRMEICCECGVLIDTDDDSDSYDVADNYPLCEGCRWSRSEQGRGNQPAGPLRLESNRVPKTPSTTETAMREA